MRLALLFFVAVFIAYENFVVGDVFLHNPRGSNNRLNGNGVTRKNANRLFDSQNNGDGGYNVGENSTTPSTSEETQFYMAYFQSGKDSRTASGSKGKSYLTIEWVNQHGCQDKDLNCNFVIQYKCQPESQHKTFKPDTMRNGEKTEEISYTGSKSTYTDRSEKDKKKIADAVITSGVQEAWEWYDKCAKRSRNQGLFTADQNLEGSQSIYTRQNPGGTRRGYECPEERDYYPYWHPTDWIDIAVLTDDETLCDEYKKESFNVKPKGECLEFYPTKSEGFKHYSEYNNANDCTKNKGIWVNFRNYLEERAQYTTEAACKAASSDSVPLIWAIPYRSEDIDNLKIIGDDVESLQRCLVALDPPECKKTVETRSNHLGNTKDLVFYRYTWTLPHFPSKEAQRCALRIRYNISTNDYDPAKTFSDQNNNPNAGVISPVTNNPTVQVGIAKLPLQLAINTAQFGRVFQDRSHIFKILPRPKTISNSDTIYNLNVRGKRGNAGQAFPAVEYDFVPKRLKITTEDIVHIQWTGSNSNPSNFAGQGTAGTDRHNFVEMASPSLSYPITSEKKGKMLENAEIVWSSDPKTETNADLLISLASSGYYSGITEISTKKTTLNTQLNNASPSYRGVALRFKAGTYYYMCTRNNAFTNRSQKGRLLVTPAKITSRKRFFSRYLNL